MSDETRVLVVDDCDDAAQALAVGLRLDGYDVRTAANGADALALIEAYKPHCVLLDVDMPVMDGREFSRRMRERYGDDVVLVAITGWDVDDERVAESFVRVDHYLQKPVSLADLRVILPPVDRPLRADGDV